MLVGADLAEAAGLKEKLIANGERYASISKVLKCEFAAVRAQCAHANLKVGPLRQS